MSWQGIRASAPASCRISSACRERGRSSDCATRSCWDVSIPTNTASRSDWITGLTRTPSPSWAARNNSFPISRLSLSHWPTSVASRRSGAISRSIFPTRTTFPEATRVATRISKPRAPGPRPNTASSARVSRSRSCCLRISSCARSRARSKLMICSSPASNSGWAGRTACAATTSARRRATRDGGSRSKAIARISDLGLAATGARARSSSRTRRAATTMLPYAARTTSSGASAWACARTKASPSRSGSMWHGSPKTRVRARTGTTGRTLPSPTAFEAIRPCEKSRCTRIPRSRMGLPFAAGMKSSGGITMSSATPRDGFRPKLLALSVAACFSLSCTQSLANPTGGSVSSGSAGFASSGNTLTVTNSANAIINWQSFSIGVNEITRFVQSSASSAVLNRVVGANGVIPQSVIDGVLSSNGRVFLINQSGILFGANARIDVAGLVASSLNLSDQDFLNGRMRFTETPGAGGVSNAGIIDTTSGGPGGRVFLVGSDVQNSGVVRSPQGEIVLAAGRSVELVSENSPYVTVRLVADAEQALNVGQLISDSGRIGMFGALVRQGGVVEANSAVVGANGEIRLVATKDLTLDAGSLTTANGLSGGTVTLQAEGGTNLISGTVEAKGSSGQGGTIQALGVRVGVIGHGVIDASGDTGGGTVLVGGDYQGGNPNVQNAQQTVIGSDGIIRADAGTTGDGGRVIVWSDESTRFFGSISARGGSQGGNGGFVETSGNALQAFGSVDTSAPRGNGGEWLLDPTDINIVANGPDPLTCLPGVCSILFNDLPGLTSQISVGTIDAGLGTNGSVTLQAKRDINLQTDLNLTYGGAGQIFTAQAGNNINLGGFNITANGTNVTLTANDAASLTPTGYGSITSGLGYGNITTSGGSVNLSGFGV